MITKIPKISIVIPTYNHLDDLLKPCINSLIQYTNLDDVEIIIVANGCTDLTKEYVESLGNPFKLIWFDDIIGYTKSTNEGIRQSTGEYILLLNNDCVLYPQPKHQWIEMLLAPFINHEVAITGAKELVCPIIKRPFLVFYCVLIKASIFSELGLLDEIFAPFFGEDIDFCQRVVGAGYKFATVGIFEKNGNFYSNFPVFHMAEGTLHDDYIQKKFSGTMPRNNNILLERYGSGNSEVLNILPAVSDDKKNTVTAIISTKDRYFSTLPLTLVAIANQTITPDVLRIYDDGEQTDLRQNPLYTNILRLLDQKKIRWFVHFGEKRGQVWNHQKSIIESDTEWIWRLDDDNIPEHDVLEKLLSIVDEKTGAVGGLVLDPKYQCEIKPDAASNKIEDIFTGLNIQWYKHEGISEVDHLYSSFIYRREAAKHGYCMELSPVGHREETIFTYEMKRNGWKILVNPDAITWHFRNAEGGIRSYPDQNLWQHDEEIFAKKINLWSIIPINRKIVILNNGLGDHLAFRHILPEMKNKYGAENILIACCFSEVFVDDGVSLMPIQDAVLYFNNNIISCDIYKMMWDMNWKGSLVDAFRRMYLV